MNHASRVKQVHLYIGALVITAMVMPRVIRDRGGHVYGDPGAGARL